MGGWGAAARSSLVQKENQKMARARASLSETLANLIGEAVTDIRNNVVEESWFGRHTTSERPTDYEQFLPNPGSHSEPKSPNGQEQDIDIA
jgi:hypothetical protein